MINFFRGLCLILCFAWIYIGLELKQLGVFSSLVPCVKGCYFSKTFFVLTLRGGKHWISLELNIIYLGLVD